MSGDIPLFDLAKGAVPSQAGVAQVGPGSQGEDGLRYMRMPTEMDTFEIPELPEAQELAMYPEVGQILLDLQSSLEKGAANLSGAMSCARINLDHLSNDACALLYQTLGEGEVAARIEHAGLNVRVQESVLAGVWGLQQLDADKKVAHQWLEVGAVPDCLLTDSFPFSSDYVMPEVPAGLLNAAPVLLELLEKAKEHQQRPFTEPHVINFSLLPFSEEDHAYLGNTLSHGGAVILSRGYGNCRITSCAVPGIWRVQYFNSTDQLILDTIEIISIPHAACAAREDLEDSAERLHEIYQAMMAD